MVAPKLDQKLAAVVVVVNVKELPPERLNSIPLRLARNIEEPLWYQERIWEPVESVSKKFQADPLDRPTRRGVPVVAVVANKALGDELEKGGREAA